MAWEKDEKGEIKIGLKEAYELHEELEDPIGRTYKEEKSKFINILNLRNFSKLAHGNILFNEDEWNEFFVFVKDL